MVSVRQVVSWNIALGTTHAVVAPRAFSDGRITRPDCCSTEVSGALPNPSTIVLPLYLFGVGKGGWKTVNTPQTCGRCRRE